MMVSYVYRQTGGVVEPKLHQDGKCGVPLRSTVVSGLMEQLHWLVQASRDYGYPATGWRIGKG